MAVPLSPKPTFPEMALTQCSSFIYASQQDGNPVPSQVNPEEVGTTSLVHLVPPTEQPPPPPHERSQDFASTFVPHFSSVRPTTVDTISALFQKFENERLETVQRLEDDRRKILHEFIPSPQTQLKDTHSEPFPLLEEIKNISNAVLAGSNNFNIVLEGSVNLFVLSSNSDSPDNTSSERFFLSEEIWKHTDQNNSGFLGRPEFYNALKLVTVAQSDHELTVDIVKAALFGPAAAKIPANSHVGRLPQRTPPRATSLSDEVVALTSSAFLYESKFGFFVENNFANLDLDSMLSKAPPTSTLSIHENSNWTICVFDPGGFNKSIKFSFAGVIQQQFLESSFFTNEEQYSTTIFIFDPGGCTISIIFQQIDMIKFEMELQVATIGEETSYVNKSNSPKSCTQWHQGRVASMLER